LPKVILISPIEPINSKSTSRSKSKSHEIPLAPKFPNQDQKPNLPLYPKNLKSPKEKKSKLSMVNIVCQKQETSHVEVNIQPKEEAKQETVVKNLNMMMKAEEEPEVAGKEPKSLENSTLFEYGKENKEFEFREGILEEDEEILKNLEDGSPIQFSEGSVQNHTMKNSPLKHNSQTNIKSDTEDSSKYGKVKIESENSK
jgi:hypothetical protein